MSDRMQLYRLANENGLAIGLEGSERIATVAKELVKTHLRAEWDVLMYLVRLRRTR